MFSTTEPMGISTYTLKVTLDALFFKWFYPFLQWWKVTLSFLNRGRPHKTSLLAISDIPSPKLSHKQAKFYEPSIELPFGVSCQHKSERGRNLIFHEGTLIQLKGITSRCNDVAWLLLLLLLMPPSGLVHRIIISHPLDGLAACSWCRCWWSEMLQPDEHEWNSGKKKSHQTERAPAEGYLPAARFLSYRCSANWFATNCIKYPFSILSAAAPYWLAVYHLEQRGYWCWWSSQPAVVLTARVERKLASLNTGWLEDNAEVIFYLWPFYMSGFEKFLSVRMRKSFERFSS